MMIRSFLIGLSIALGTFTASFVHAEDKISIVDLQSMPMPKKVLDYLNSTIEDIQTSSSKMDVELSKIEFTSKPEAGEAVGRGVWVCEKCNGLWCCFCTEKPK